MIQLLVLLIKLNHNDRLNFDVLFETLLIDLLHFSFNCAVLVFFFLKNLFIFPGRK